MEVLGTTEKINDPGLPLASLRLLVPPLQLCSAAMWQLAKQKDVLNYHKLQEFVLTVTEAVPGLINHRQRAQLILGLRARLILELCRETSSRGSVNTQLIHSHLERLPITSDSSDYRDAEVRTTESTFIALVQSLLKDPVERAYFFQEVFPVEYGPRYDGALHVLLWELLSKLEKLFPVPDLKQTAAWLGSSPSVLEECVQSSPEELSSVFEHYKNSGLLKIPYGPSSTIGSCIFSALSIPPSQKNNLSVGLQSVHNYANVLNPVTLVGTDQCTVVAVYTEVEAVASDVREEIIEAAEVQVQTDCYEEEIVAVSVDNAVGEECAGAKAEDAGETVDVAKALETLTKAFALRKESLSQEVEKVNDSNAESCVTDVAGAGEAADKMDTCDGHEPNAQTEVTGGHEEVKEGLQLGAMETSESSHAEPRDNNEESLSEESTHAELPDSEAQQLPSSTGIRRSTRLQMRTSPGWREKLQRSSKEVNGEPKMSRTDASPTVIAIKGDSDEMTSMIFTCLQCSFHDSDENSAPHFHMQRVRTDVYRNLLQAKFTPTPSSTDEIFTSIKLFPNRNAEQSKAEQPEDPSVKDGPVEAPTPYGRKKALTCETCGKTFTRTSDVKRHQLTHTGERPFHCSQCDRTFQHSWDLAKHESKHHNIAISFDCQLCRSSFANLRALTVHHKSTHWEESELPQMCSICSRSFPSTPELLEHRKSHVSSKRYLCQQCGEGFDSLLARSQHRQVHRVKRQFKCPHCEKTYTRRSDVKRHLSTHTGLRPYQCNQCSKRFSLRFMLIKHLRVHTGERPFQCSHCPKRFTLVSVLARHERMHTGEKPFLCSQCGKGFLSQGELSKHQRSHVDDRPYSCSQCDKRFKSKKTMQEHVASHSGARPYPCTICGKGFTKPYALIRHNLIHTGERPFPCSHCEKSFLTLSEAQLHQRIHTGERPYPCKLCELKFRSSSELARHKRGHSGLKPPRHSCKQCMKTFTSQIKLKKHIETHGEEREAAQTFDSVQTEGLECS